MLFESVGYGRRCGLTTNKGAYSRPPCERRARFARRDGNNYFFTISAFSIIAIPPRSAILPFSVIVLPQ